MKNIKIHITNNNNTNDAQWLLCFYGFGQNELAFKPLMDNLSNQYSFIIIHLPYENEDENWTKSLLKQEVIELFDELKIKKFVGISYSVGSRMNLCLAETMPERINKMILIAPDGIKIGFWNHFATSSVLGLKLFDFLIHHKTLLPDTLTKLYKLKILPKSLFLFSAWHIRDSKSRNRVFNVWIKMKNLIPNLSLIKENAKQFSFPIVAYFGKNDEIINKKCMNKLINQMPSAKVVLLNKGHNMLDKELFNDIATYLSI